MQAIHRRWGKMLHMIEFGHFSHVGLQRNLNEDTYYGDAGMGLWLVADGMGGHATGEVASAIARDVVVQEVKQGSSLEQAIHLASESIAKVSRVRGDRLPMGTTIAAMQLQGNRYESAWVGDSRIYMWHEGKLVQLSHDHSHVQALVQRGLIDENQARAHPKRNVLTQALGVTGPQPLHVDVLRGELLPGMQLLLCSDGLTHEVSDAAINKVLCQTDCSAQECVEQLIHAALDAGGSDNITALLIKHH